MDKLSRLSEREIIERFFIDPDAVPVENQVGIGDDCAVLNTPGNRHVQTLVTTDLLVEQVHFQTSYFSAEEIGHKAIAINLSDIAAMGGRPTAAFLSVALPSRLSTEWVEDFSRGFLDLCRKFDVPLLGGDTSSGKKDIIVSVTVLGKADHNHVKLRSDAQPGDRIFVTGTLGDSAAGFELLNDGMAGLLEDEEQSFLVGRQKRPAPTVKEGAWLGRQASVHAMIDLSDGLAADAGHLSRSSALGFDINLDQIPLSDPFKKYTGQDEDKAIKLALGGGEDYHLLFTVSGSDAENIADSYQNRFGTPLYEIGKVTDQHKGVAYYRNNNSIDLPVSGFDHFKR